MSNLKESRRRVCVAVPATSANMGAGFDCIGMALNIWNELTLEISNEFSFNTEGEEGNDLPKDESNLVIKSVMCAYKMLHKEMPRNIKFTCKNRIPFARGLGSSSAAIVGGLLGGLYLAGYDLETKYNIKTKLENCVFANESMNEIILNCAASIEGHADNVAPALYGGMQIGLYVKTIEGEKGEDKEERKVENDEGRWISNSVKLTSNIKCIIYVPNTPLKTEEARGVLPNLVSRKDAVFNISRSALLVNALTNNSLDILKYAVDDTLHEPYREKLNFHYRKIKKAAIEAGAYSVHLSGSGPSVLAIIHTENGNKKNDENFSQKEYENKIINAMLKAAEDVSMQGKIFVTYPSHIGAHITSLDPPLSDNRIDYFTSFKSFNAI